MKIVLWVNHVLISAFALMSGLYKVGGGAADLDVFSHLGMTAVMVMVFGAVQALGGFALVFARSARAGAYVVTACNALATAGLFAAGVQPFGVISILFVAMAALELRLDRGAGGFARPRLGAPSQPVAA